MTANAIFFGARHGVGPPRHLFTSPDGATRLQKTLGGSKFGMEPTAIWGMSVYDVEGDLATGRATTVVSIATPTGYKIMGQGAYQDDIAKVAGEWKIRRRRVVNDHLVSGPAKPVNLADPDVSALVRQLIDTANDLAPRGSGDTKT